MVNNIEELKIEFVSFCIENFKAEYKMKGKNVAELFERTGAIDFLYDGYDLLHTQGKDYILSEIVIFLENRGYSVDSLSWK